MDKLNLITKKIEEKYHPISIFLYGSRAKGDYKKDSDYEIGVLFGDKKYVHRRDLQKLSLPNYNIFPFKLSEFRKASSDVPFEENVFFRELKLTAKTLA